MDRRVSLKLALFAIWATFLVLIVNGKSACDTYRFANNLVFAQCSTLQALGSFLHWTYNESNGTVSIAYRQPGTSSSTWIVWGINPSSGGMVGTQALVAFINSTGQFRAYTSPVNSYNTQLLPGSLSFRVSRMSATLVGGEGIIFATLELPQNLIVNNQVWQMGPVANGAPSIHPTSGENVRSIGRINFRSGQ